MTTLLDAALRYAEAGWPVVPLHTPIRGVCDCGKKESCTSPGKHPRTIKGVDDSSRDPEKITKWWRMWPKANVAVDLARAGLLDVAPDSPVWHARFIAQGLPRTANFQSGGGAGHEHYLYQRPATSPVHRLCKEGEYDLLSAGYAVMPPSLHVSGQAYAWIQQGQPAAPPDWAVTMLQDAVKRVRVDRGTSSVDEPPVRLDGEDLERWHGRLVTAKPDGTVDRSQSLWWIACALAQAGATRSTIVQATQERDETLGWGKYLERTDVQERYEVLADRALTSKASVQPVVVLPTKLPAGGPRIWEGPELAAMVFDMQRWAIPNLLPAGLTILAGRPKLGKSWLALGWALDIARPALALRKLKVAHGRTLYLALEDGPQRMQERMQLMLGEVPPPRGFHVATEWRRTNEGGLDDLVAWLTEHPDTRLIVIDTFKRIRPVEKNSQRLYDLDYDAIAPLAELARQHNVAIVLVFHTRKAVSDDPLEMVSGTMGVSGAADAVLVLRRERGQADASLFVTGRDVEEQDLALRWEKEDELGWALLGNAEQFRISKERKAVLDTLATVPGMRPMELAEMIGTTKGVMRRLLFSMVREEEVRERDGKYYVALNIVGNGNAPAHSEIKTTQNGVTGVTLEMPRVTDVTDVTGVTRVSGVTEKHASCRVCGGELQAGLERIGLHYDCVEGA